MIATICQECGSSVDVPDEYLRRPVKCAGCQKVFVALPLDEARERFEERVSEETDAPEPGEPIYYFRLKGKVLCASTVRELAANKMLLQTDAVSMDAVPREGGPPVPLADLIDFTKPWRTVLPEGQEPPKLPERKAGMFDNWSTGDPLKPLWNGEYSIRMAGNSHPITDRLLRQIVNAPPFQREDYWLAEVKQSYTSGPWVPLTSLVVFTNGWPVPPGDSLNSLPPNPASAQPISQLFPIGDAPETSSISMFAWVVGAFGAVGGVVLMMYAINVQSLPVGISGAGAFAASIIQAYAVSLFCRLSTDVYVLRRENQQILEQLKKLEPQP